MLVDILHVLCMMGGDPKVGRALGIQGRVGQVPIF
jgi:hypothetical protein